LATIKTKRNNSWNARADGAGFLVILLSRLRQTPQSEDTNLCRAFCVCIANQGTTEDTEMPLNEYVLIKIQTT